MITPPYRPVEETSPGRVLTPTRAQIKARMLSLHRIEYDPCVLRCMGCHRASDQLPYRKTVPMATDHGWATCSVCNLQLDPKHPEDGPVIPFEVTP